MDNFVKLDRSLTAQWWYKDASLRLVMLHLIFTANHADVQMPGVIIHRGQTLTSRAKLSSEIGLTEKVIRRCFKQLSELGEVNTKRANKGPKSGTVVTLCKYDSYTMTNTANIAVEGQLRANKRANKGPIKKESNISNNQPLSNMEKNKESQERANKRAANNIVVRINSNKLEYNTHSVGEGARGREECQVQISKTQEIENLKKRFFREENRGQVEQLCMSLHCSLADFQEIANEIFAEWILTDEPVKDSYNAVAKHLIATARIKIAERRRAAAREPQETRSREERSRDMQNFIYNTYFKNAN